MKQGMEIARSEYLVAYRPRLELKTKIFGIAERIVIRKSKVPPTVGDP
jgi:hypothetical protein